MLRGIWKDPERFKDTYWSRFEGRYFAGDGAKFDEDGDIWLLGRVDDVMKISGHRISTTEVESALVSHPKVAEAAHAAGCPVWLVSYGYNHGEPIRQVPAQRYLERLDDFVLAMA